LKILNKRMATILCVCMVLASCISGTLAYLTSEAGDKNTFVVGRINIQLSESDTKIDEDDDENTNTYKVEEVGQYIAKDPVVTVLSGSAPCWLFVELTKSENYDEFLEYEIEEGWEKLDGEKDVYYQKIDGRTFVDTKYQVLKNNIVKVKDGVTAEKLNQLTDETYPTLTVKASAIQQGAEGTEIGTAEDAWEQVKSQ